MIKLAGVILEDYLWRLQNILVIEKEKINMVLKIECPQSLGKMLLQQEEKRAEKASLLVLENTKFII